jgi:hypothetical protein
LRVPRFAIEAGLIGLTALFESSILRKWLGIEFVMAGTHPAFI